MTNKQLEILIKLRDEMSKRLTGIEGRMQKFAATWRRNWLGISAAITAGFLAAQKAWRLMEDAMRFEQQEAAFRNLAASFGVNADDMIAKLKELSGQTLSTADVMEKASQAMILGLDPSKLPRLMEIARASARAFGKDVGFMFDSIVTGIGRQSKLILDNLGIVFNASDAYEEYAAKIGKTAKELTDTERKQAFLNKTLQAGEDILKRVDVQFTTNFEKMQALKARWQDFSVSIGNAFWHVLGVVQGFLDQIVTGIFTALNTLTLGLRKFEYSLARFYDFLGQLPGKVGDKYEQAAAKARQFADNLELTNEAFSMSAERSAQSALESYNTVFAKVKEQAATVTRVVQDGNDDIQDDTMKTFKAEEEFAKQSARNIQNAFSTFFFKAFTGELRNLNDVFAEFGRTMLQTLANVLSQLILIKSLERIFGQGGSIFGVPIGNLFHSGGVVRAHSGMLARGEVPAILQTGEGVVSRRGMAALGASGLNRLNRGDSGGGQVIQPTVIIKAWDATDIFRHEKEIKALVADSIRSNGLMRDAIRRYA